MPPLALWPPPRDPRIAAELIDAAEQRDPIGHGLHLILAALFCAFGGIATSTLEFTAGFLLFYAALRLPNTWRTYPPTMATLTASSIVAWFLWTALTLIWSPDPRAGLEHFAAFRMLLVIPALWPIIRHHRGLALCLVAGMCVQVIGLALNSLGWTHRPGDGLNRYVGFGSHPGHVTLWLSMAAMAAISLVRGSSPVMKFALIMATAILIVGSFAAGGRGSLLGLCCGAIVMLAVILTTGRLGIRQWLAVLAVVVVIAGATAFLRGDDLAKSYARIETQLDKSERKGDPRSSISYRLYWWQLAIKEWRSAPILGTGSGSWHEWASYQPETLRLADRLNASTDDLILSHPHSLYLQTLAETGAIGGALVLLVGFSLARGSFATARHDPVALAGITSLVVWGVSSIFEGNQTSPRSMAAFSLAVAFATLPALVRIAPVGEEKA
jgi:O-antigen ligase